MLADGEKRGIFTRDQVVANAILLLLAGHETTINLICNGTLAFIQHPEQWEALKNDTGEVIPSLLNRATEECLRYDPPVKSLQRIVDEDVELRGKIMKKRERVRWFISGANRDPEKFENADTFDPTFPIWLNIPLSNSSAFFKPLSICETLAVGMAIITP